MTFGELEAYGAGLGTSPEDTGMERQEQEGEGEERKEGGRYR
jgi:hypothetical protein